MRIRLQVLRHQLPPTKVLWKPLQTNDIRARNLAGRHQISKDGRHLVDGIAFGRPLLRAPSHAPIHIPPRKRARLDPELEESDAALQLGDYGPPPSAPESAVRTKSQKHVTFSPEFMEADYKDNGDMVFDDYDHGDDDEDDDFEPPSDDEFDQGEDEIMKLLEDRDKKSHGGEDETTDESSSDSDSDTDDSDDDDAGGSGSDSDAPSEEPIKKQTDTYHRSTPKQAPPSDGKQRTRARNRRRRDAKKLTWLKSTGKLPESATRQDLKKWREDQVGQDHTTDADSDSDDESSSSSESDSSSDSDSDSEPETVQTQKVVPPAVKKPVAMIPRQLKVKPKGKKPVTEDKSEEFSQKREALLAALQSGGIDVNHDLSAPSEDTVMANADLNTLYVGDDSPPAQPEPRRARLDIASSNRLLFNSLGVRAPKNDADRQRLQAKLAQPTRKPVTKPAPATAASIEQPSSAEEEQDPTDIDAWKSKISLSAVECAPGSEEYYYSTPPFPFYQRWDPSQRTKKRKRNSQAFDSAKLQRTEGEIDNSYNDYYNDGADGDALNYGDDEDDTAGAAQEADQEAATAQLLAESSDAADLPALPSDLTTLPPLTPGTTVPGAIITFARFEVSAATNWAPAMSPVRTASIQHVSDNKTLGLQLAKRDIPGKQYDSQGRRLFDKFEMITGDEEDEEEDVGFLEVELAELIDARLLQAAEVAQKTVGVDEQGGIEEKGEEQMIGIAL
ncbi:unnamed protein product [Aureobasidium pullulans]|nr:unnamed protein product [Aureobasidium pullulans]